MHIHPEQRQGLVERRRMDQQHNIGRHLRTLSQDIPEPYDWAEFRRRASRQRTNAYAREGANRKKYAAIAAALFLVVVGAAAWVLVTRSGTPEPIDSDGMSGRDRPGSSGAPDSIDSRADAAERWLASFPSEPIVVRVGTRAAAVGLEDRIAQLDDFLSAARVDGAQPAKLVAVEEQRARLVNSLVQVRYAETLVSRSR